MGLSNPFPQARSREGRLLSYPVCPRSGAHAVSAFQLLEPFGDITPISSGFRRCPAVCEVCSNSLSFYLHRNLRGLFLHQFSTWKKKKKGFLEKLSIFLRVTQNWDSKPDLTLILMFWAWLISLKKLSNPSKREEKKKRVNGTWTKISNNQKVSAQNGMKEIYLGHLQFKENCIGSPEGSQIVPPWKHRTNQRPTGHWLFSVIEFTLSFSQPHWNFLCSAMDRAQAIFWL